MTVRRNVIADNSGGTTGTGIASAIWLNGNVTAPNNITITDNDLYGWQRSTGFGYLVTLDSPLSSSTVTITSNKLYQDGDDPILTAGGSIGGGWTFTGNTYHYPSLVSTDPFPSGSFAAWVTATGETGTNADPAYDDPTRDLVSYMASIGGTETEQAFVDAAKDMLDTWNPVYSAYAAIDHVRAGFNRAATETAPAWYTAPAAAASADLLMIATSGGTLILETA